MTRLVSWLPVLSVLLACCTTDDPPSTVAPVDARAANAAAFAVHGARLAAERPGAWVLIADGAVQGTWDDFEPAWTAASARHTEHQYLYRAGIDDRDDVFVLSPFVDPDTGWVQLGRRMVAPWRLTMAAAPHEWHRRSGDRDLVAHWPDDLARVTLASPDGSTARTVATAASMLFEHDLTLTPTLAAELGLGRIEAPGSARYTTDGAPCRKVPVRVRVPELEIDVVAIGFVLPADLVGASGR